MTTTEHGGCTQGASDENILCVNHLTILFQGLRAVDDISIQVKRGIIYGIIGPNGAGKTTLFNMISGVLKPTEGEVLYNGANTVGLKPWQICKLGIARTYQNLNIFENMTVRENILVGRHTKLKTVFFDAMTHNRKYQVNEKLENEKAEGLMEFLGIADYADTLAKNLPYGGQRRLEIARAMASEPQLLLLDEPAAGMNTQEKLALQETIQKIRQANLTILLIEHDMKLVMQITDHICAINYGKKIVEGSPETVRSNPDVIAAYLGGGKHAKALGG